MFCNPTALGVGSYHEATDVLEEDERDVALIAKLNEMCALQSRFASQGPITAEDADLLAVDAGKAGDEGGAVVGLEFTKEGAVGEAGEDVVCGDVGAEREG